MLPSDDLFKAALVAADNAADAEVSTSRLHDCFVWCAPVLPEGQRLQSIAAGLQPDRIKRIVCVTSSYRVAVDDTATVAAHVSHKEKK